MSSTDQKHTWVQTHKELAQYLKDKEDDQEELIELLKEAGSTQFNDKDDSDNSIDLDEIDPFTFFAYINKYGDEKRLSILQNIAEKLGLSKPEDVLGLPTFNALNVRFFPYKYERNNNEVDRLWSLFYDALDHSITDEKFEDALSIRSTGKASLTAALFYVDPEKYLPINGPAKPYLSKHLSIDVNFKSFSEYQQILNQVKEKVNLPIYGISHESWLWTEKYEKNEAKREQWLELVSQYKTYLKQNKYYDELYKWEAIQQFQDTYDPDASDFASNLKDSISKSSNLLYQNSKGFITKTVEYFPEEVRNMFEMLYDESESLENRIEQFVSKSEELEPKVSEKHGKKLNHQQDERTLSFYLTMKYPDQYPLYKDEIYQYLVSQIPGEESKSAGEKFYHYLDIGEILIPAIEDDEELFELATQNLNEDCYSGEQKWLIFQDILWVNKRNIDAESDTNYWIFQGSPDVFDTEKALKNNALTGWRVNTHKGKITPGDKVILWTTGDNRGCYALCEVKSDVYEDRVHEDEIPYYNEEQNDEPFDQVELKITHNLAENPITYDQIKEVDALSDLKAGNQGTNFSATKVEFDTFVQLAEMVGSAYLWNQLVDRVEIIDDEEAIKKFFKTIEHVLIELNLNPDDEVIYASAIKNYIQFTIGSRYVTHIERKKDRIVQGFYVDNAHLDELKSNYPNLSISDKAVPPEKGDMTWVYLEAKDVNIVDFFDGIVALSKKGVDSQEKSQFRSIYPDKHNPWIARVALNDTLLKKLLRGEKMPEKNVQPKVNYPLNTIFYGPPGTGKTYTTIKRAAEIVEGREIEDYEEAKTIFNKHLGETIEFITFHQNYSYEDFIQGLRPDTENDKELTFDRVDGLFKELADKALKNYKASGKPQTKKKNFEDVFNIFISPLVEGEVEEIEVEMKRVSYFITAVTNRSIEFRKASGGTAHTLSISTLRRMYEAESVLEIQGLSSYYSPLLDKLLDMGRSPGETEIVEKKNYVIIIDEINRANISRVFGELITLIEPDKRFGADLHIPAKLPSGEEFSVPENLYIIGTMNTADKSIALLDIALRRRFDFEAMYPKYEIDGEEIHDKDVLKKINDRIKNLKGHDFQIGHSYFMKNHISLKQRMNRKVIPLLLEYFMNDEKEVKDILTYAGLIVKEDVWPLEITGRA